MKDFFQCANCGNQYNISKAVQEGKNLFCTYKCTTLWKAGIPNLRQHEEDQNEDEEFQRIAHLARTVA